MVLQTQQMPYLLCSGPPAQGPRPKLHLDVVTDNVHTEFKEPVNAVAFAPDCRTVVVGDGAWIRCVRCMPCRRGAEGAHGMCMVNAMCACACVWVTLGAVVYIWLGLAHGQMRDY